MSGIEFIETMKCEICGKATAFLVVVKGIFSGTETKICPACHQLKEAGNIIHKHLD